MEGIILLLVILVLFVLGRSGSRVPSRPPPPPWEETKPFRLPAHLKPLPLDQVKMYAKLVTTAREGCRTIFTAEGTKELPAEEYEQMLVESWTNMGSDYVFMMMDNMIAGARKK